jgi:hypothetical protein
MSTRGAPRPRPAPKARPVSREMKKVHIIPNEPKDGECTISSGTRVLIADQPIESVTRIVVTYEIDDLVRAQLDLCDVWQDPVEALGEFFMTHPHTGKRAVVKRIEFADESVVDF